MSSKLGFAAAVKAAGDWWRSELERQLDARGIDGITALYHPDETRQRVPDFNDRYVIGLCMEHRHHEVGREAREGFAH